MIVFASGSRQGDTTRIIPSAVPKVNPCNWLVPPRTIAPLTASVITPNGSPGGSVEVHESKLALTVATEDICR